MFSNDGLGSPMTEGSGERRALAFLLEHVVHERADISSAGMALMVPDPVFEQLFGHPSGTARRDDRMGSARVGGVPLIPGSICGQIGVAGADEEPRYILPWRPSDPNTPWETVTGALADGLSLSAAVSLADLESR